MSTNNKQDPIKEFLRTPVSETISDARKRLRAHIQASIQESRDKYAAEHNNIPDPHSMSADTSDYNIAMVPGFNGHGVPWVGPALAPHYDIESIKKANNFVELPNFKTSQTPAYLDPPSGFGPANLPGIMDVPTDPLNPYKLGITPMPWQLSAMQFPTETKKDGNKRQMKIIAPDGTEHYIDVPEQPPEYKFNPWESFYGPDKVAKGPDKSPDKIPDKIPGFDNYHPSYHDIPLDLSGLANPMDLIKPQLMGLPLGDMYGLTYDSDSILNILNNASKEKYASLRQAYDDSYNQFLNTMVANQGLAQKTLKDSESQAVATGASQGMLAANQLSAILGMQQQGTDDMLKLTNERNQLAGKETAEIAENSSKALETSNNIRNLIANLDLNKYGYDTQQYVGQLDFNAAVNDALAAALAAKLQASIY